MNKYLRQRKFAASYARNPHKLSRFWAEHERAVRKSFDKKNNPRCGIVLLSLLICLVLYFLFLHFNAWGFKDWLNKVDGVNVSGGTTAVYKTA